MQSLFRLSIFSILAILLTFSVIATISFVKFDGTTNHDSNIGDGSHPITQADNSATLEGNAVSPEITEVNGKTISTESLDAKSVAVDTVAAYSVHTLNAPDSDHESNVANALIPSAYAITSTQLSVTSSEWTIPTANSWSQKITSGTIGMLYFTENVGNKIAKLDTTVTPNVITEWTLAGSNSSPNGIVVSGGNVYFTEIANKIGRLNPSTNVITEWNIPTASSYPGRIAVNGGNFYFI